MQIEYLTPKAPALQTQMRHLLESNRHSTLIFTRVEREVIAIVPVSNHKAHNRVWVWLSSYEDGAYCDAVARSEESLARTLAMGNWVYQRDATMKVVK